MARAIRFPYIPDTDDILDKLSSEQYEKLKDRVRGKNGIEITDTDADKLAAELGISNGRELKKLFTMLQFLYSTVLKPDSPGETVREKLNQFFEVAPSVLFKKRDKSSIVDRLVGLLENNESVDVQAKREWLSTGILNTVTDISSFVDLRPNMDSGRTKIRELIPIIILEIKYNDGRDEEFSTILQLTEKDLVIVKKALEDVEKKLKLLRSDKRFDGIVFAEN